jgi:uncharacterized protein (TIGR02145 family)
MKFTQIIVLLILTSLINSCSSLFEKEEVDPCSGTITHNEQTYTKVRAGKQCWIKEDIQPANSATEFKKDDGIYYYHAGTWADKNVCPTGYRIPNKNDWENLGADVVKLSQSYVGYKQIYFQYDIRSKSFTSIPSIRSKNEANFWIVSGEGPYIIMVNGKPDQHILKRQVISNSQFYSYYFSVKCVQDE